MAKNPLFPDLGSKYLGRHESKLDYLYGPKNSKGEDKGMQNQPGGHAGEQDGAKK